MNIAHQVSYTKIVDDENINESLKNVFSLEIYVHLKGRFFCFIFPFL